MKKLHLAIATNDIESSITDYSNRLGCRPCVVVPDEYALWRTNTINLSIRRDPTGKPGELRHLGWEDPEATEFSTSMDVNGIIWENFTAQQQADEIEIAWPGTHYMPSREVES
jgi:hypothetical protein